MDRTNILQLWILPISDDTKLVSDYEKNLSKKLSPKRSKEFLYTRGCVREVLADFFNIKPLRVPLEAPPGKPPKLKNGLGNITLSHCKDALFIGWSDIRIGVDIERKDRNLKSASLIKRFYCEEEKKELENLNQKDQRQKALKFWIIKEAAIKWQEGSIAKDLPYWLIKEEQNKIYHEKLDILLNTEYKNHSLWSLGIAHKSNNLEIKPLIKLT
tara:strand:+ start:164 stop:805 length:642 start_codon:yes stop_codon:yes gene_type:complete